MQGETLTFFLGTPNNQLQAHLAQGMPVLISFAAKSAWIEKGWLESFSSLLLDSGAFSELNSGVKVDLAAYADWAQSIPFAVAWAGLDDITGDWKRSIENYKAGGFPTFHDADPDPLLDDLIPLARERGGWIGIGLTPPRAGREPWLRRTLERIPDDLHVHAWACGRYAGLSRIDSVDSTNWFRDVKYLRDNPLTKHLTVGECLEVIVKRYQRQSRRVSASDQQLSLPKGEVDD